MIGRAFSYFNGLKLKNEETHNTTFNHIYIQFL